MICPAIFKGASPTCAIICLCDLVNREKDTYQVSTLVFSCGCGGSRARKKSIFVLIDLFQ